MATFKKIIFSVLLLFISIALSAQVYTPMTASGYKMKRVAVDSTLHIPSFCGVPKLLDTGFKIGAIAIDTCNNVLFQWTRLNGWTPISTGTYLDTNSLSNRINQRVKYTDTAAMLLPYLRKIDTTAMLSKYLRKTDTASLSNRINLKVNISDTATMLSKYLIKTDTASLSNRINLKVNISDTASMLNPYLRKIDTTNKFVNRLERVVGKDSIIFFIGGTRYAIKDSSGGGGTVTTAVDTIYRTIGKDSIQFTIGGRYRAIKDSSGGSGVFSKNIIMNGTTSNRLGNYVNGDTIKVAGLGLDSAFKIITQKAVAPTYVQASTTISSSPFGGYFEIGTPLNITLSSTFTQNDAGSLTATTYYKNNTTPLGGNTDAITITSTTQYKVTKTYNQGACKTNNLGDIDCTGRINAGSVTSSNLFFLALPKRYWGYTSSATPNSSQVINANGGGSELSSDFIKTGFNVTVSGTNQYIYYAYPVYFGQLNSIVISGLESIGAFNQTTVSVTNAQGYTQNYYVYTSQNQFNNTTVNFTSVN